MHLNEYVGHIHLHSTYSDGVATIEEIIRLANQAGLDFIIPTDHNVLVKGLDGWYGNTLLLMGEEVHDRERRPESSHYLALNIEEDVFPYAQDPQAVINAVNNQGGFGFLAHPIEYDTPPFVSEGNFSWRDWQVGGYTGLELWNYMSEFKSHLPNKAAAILFCYFPRLVMRGPYPDTLAKWDELLRERKIVVIGGSDAHGNTYRLGPLRRVVQPYDYLFHTVNTHILSQEAFNGQLTHDKRVVCDALKEGRCFVAYDLLGEPCGFRFTAESGDVGGGKSSSTTSRAIMGQEIALQGEVSLEVHSPLRADIRLLRDGRIVARRWGKSLRWTTAAMPMKKGVYRVEAYRSFLLRKRGWVFTNPIYVR
jgi:hypothetical protein